MEITVVKKRTKAPLLEQNHPVIGRLTFEQNGSDRVSKSGKIVKENKNKVPNTASRGNKLLRIS